jgi:hypothetical protein
MSLDRQRATNGAFAPSGSACLCLVAYGRNLMSIRLAGSYVVAGALAMCFATASSDTANAQATALKKCGMQYQTAKAANELNSQSWQDFLKACRARLAEQPAEAEAPAFSGVANAQAKLLTECSTKYQATRAANELKGQSWQDFLKACRARVAEQPAPAQAPGAPRPAPAPTVESTPTPAPAPVAAPAPVPIPASPSKPTAENPASEPAPMTAPGVAPAKPATEGKAAKRSRQKWCATEWKAQKGELKKGSLPLKWPQYWNECDKRLKAAGQRGPQN